MAENDLRAYYLFAMKAMADITGTLLVPGLLAVLLRSVYDHLAYEQLIFFISLAVVFVLSMLTVVKKVQRYGEEYKKLTDTQPPSSGSSSGS
jgi:glucan phosphoethanolaminetransferase (alkaline phosphatase superfamily)